MKTIKKGLGLLLAVVVLCGTLVMTSYAADVMATPTKSTLNFNNNAVNLDGYTIDGSNYFKLRDLAVVIKDNGKNFSVNWERATNTVNLISGQSYNPVGGELTLSGSKASVTAIPTTSVIYLNSSRIYLTAYLINDTNYIKLRDLAAALDVAVTFDETINMISVDTWKEYYVTTIMDILDGSYYLAASKIVKYASPENGGLTVEKKDARHFVLTADSISGSDMNAKFKTLIGLYVSTPDTVINTLQGLKYNGSKELTIDGKTLFCVYNGNTQSIDMKW